MLAPKRVFVLLINAGTDNEGIHSIKMGTRDKVLMFESEDDATRYALMLEAQDFPAPSVEPFPEDEIEAFCREAGYECELVKEGRLEIPPEVNLDHDWSNEGKRTPPEPTATEEREMSDSQLEDLRRRFERLL